MAPLLMLLAVAVLHVKPVFLHQSFQDPGAFRQDIVWGGPFMRTQTDALFHLGIPPLWYSQQVMGAPFLGLYLPGVLHPVTLLSFLFSAATSYAVLSALNALLVALFAFLFFTRAGASDWGSAAAGFLAAMTGFVPWVTLMWPVGLPQAWLLCWMWSAMGILERPLLRRFGWNLAAGFGIVMSGDAQITVQGAYLLAAWFGLWVLLSRAPARRVLRAVVVLAGAALAAYLLVTAQLLPATLYFHSTIVTRTPTLGDYASTYPKALMTLAAGGAIFSRMLENLFLPVSVLLLLLAALTRRRRNPAFLAALVLTAAFGVLVLGGRSGLAVVPFHLPMLKSFIRHYKWAVILQGPLFIGVALGFDALIELLREKRRAWAAAGLVAIALTLPLLPGPAFMAMVAAAAAVFGWAIYKRAQSPALPALLFILLVLDAGTYDWQTPYSLEMPAPDQVYHNYVRRLGPAGRVQGLFPWRVLATSRINQPLPAQGAGYFGEYTIDSWIEFPLRNHARLLAAICPAVARVEDGKFSRVDFSTCFKSTDFINPRNRHLVNLVALRYFFLQDMALAEADRYPILLDPANYNAVGGLDKLFAPWRAHRADVSVAGEKTKNLPVLQSGEPGRYVYRRAFHAGTRFEAEVRIDAAPSPAWTAALASAGGRWSLLYAREAGPGPATTPVASALPVGDDGAIIFGIWPEGAADVTWINPTIFDPAKTIKYREGARVMVFENTEALGRARIVHRSLAAASVEQAFNLARLPETFDPRVETIVVSPAARPEDGPAPAPTETATVAEENQSRLTVTARLDRPGWLVLSDTYYPGWRAFDRSGRELPIHLADISMRAVRLPVGDHRVTFLYQPLDFEIGLWVTIAGLVSALAVIAVRVLRPRPHAPSGTPVKNHLCD